MKKEIISSLFLLCLWSHSAQSAEVPDIDLRYNAQWRVEKDILKKIQAKYGCSRIRFDKEGRAIPLGVPSDQVSRWEKLYHLCMKDGCVYCDAPEGSCETGTCGPQNIDCKPFLNTAGQPKCGKECADFALSILIQT